MALSLRALPFPGALGVMRQELPVSSRCIQLGLLSLGAKVLFKIPADVLCQAGFLAGTSYRPLKVVPQKKPLLKQVTHGYNTMIVCPYLSSLLAPK